jgi:5-formyltetrahydrofolate cyclo-ligase
MNQLEDAKDDIRTRVWANLEDAEAVPQGVHGHIPAFTGADQAANRLRALSEWRAAHVIKANPDRAQLPTRTHALNDRKLLYMAVPSLAGEQPFYLLDPTTLPVSAADAARSDIAKRVATTVDVEEMQRIDMVVCGSVAVNHSGARLGKGAGYSDIEVGLLVDAGLIGPWTTIVTTVHTLQIVHEPIPEADHDFRVDIIVSPEGLIHCNASRRPRGLVWKELPQQKITAIPALARRLAQRTRRTTDSSR